MLKRSHLVLISLMALTGCNSGGGEPATPGTGTTTEAPAPTGTTDEEVVLSRVAAVQIVIDETLAAERPVELTESLLTGLPAEDVINFINEYITENDSGAPLADGTHIRPLVGTIDGRQYTSFYYLSNAIVLRTFSSNVADIEHLTNTVDLLAANGTWTQKITTPLFSTKCEGQYYNTINIQYNGVDTITDTTVVNPVSAHIPTGIDCVTFKNVNIAIDLDFSGHPGAHTASSFMAMVVDQTSYSNLDKYTQSWDIQTFNDARIEIIRTLDSGAKYHHVLERY